MEPLGSVLPIQPGSRFELALQVRPTWTHSSMQGNSLLGHSWKALGQWVGSHKAQPTTPKPSKAQIGKTTSNHDGSMVCIRSCRCPILGFQRVFLAPSSSCRPLWGGQAPLRRALAHLIIKKPDYLLSLYVSMLLYFEFRANYNGLTQAHLQ